MASKADVRAWAREISPPTSIESEAVASRIAGWLEAVSSGIVLVYLSMPGEIQAERVAELGPDRHDYATTRTPPDGPLTIHPLSSTLERHRFGYEQPVPESARIDPLDVAVVLVPGLAFDRRGHRVGWGKGYYDQLLSTTDAIRVGVTLERRITAEIPVEPHDRAMDLLATEERLLEVSGRQPASL